MEVCLRTMNGRNFPVTVEASDPVSKLQQHIADTQGIPMERQRLIYLGKELQPDGIISDYGIQKGDTIIFLLRFRPADPLPVPAAKPEQPKPEPPKVKEELEKCWSLAYTEEWEKAKEYLESGKVTLAELEERTQKDLLIFFCERDMKSAVEYIIGKRGKPSLAATLQAVIATIKHNRFPTFIYLLDEIHTVKELESLADEPQPLHYASAWGRIFMIQKLLKEGANVNLFIHKEAEGFSSKPVGTPLMAASCTGRDATDASCIDLLIDHGADVNFQNPANGDSVLHMICQAMWASDAALIQLIKNGADLNMKNHEGKRAMDNADLKDSFKRIFNMASKGKIKSRKRKSPDGEEVEEEPLAKRVKREDDSPIFHTLPEDSSRLSEWTRTLGEDEEDDDTGESRKDKGAAAIKDAIETDLLTIADSASPLAPAAKIAQSIAQSLSDVVLGTDTDSHWIPFIVEVPATKKKSSIMISIRQAIRAPKAKLSQKKIGPKTSYYFGQDEDEETPEGVKNALKLLRAETKELTEVRFPEEAICYPVFLGGTVAVNNEKYAIVGVYAIRVDT